MSGHEENNPLVLVSFLTVCPEAHGLIWRTAAQIYIEKVRQWYALSEKANQSKMRK